MHGPEGARMQKDPNPIGRMLALMVVNSPCNKDPTKLIESARNELVKGIYALKTNRIS